MTEPLTAEDVARMEQVAGPVYEARSADDFMLFARGLIVPSASGPMLFNECMAPFQEETFRDLEPSLYALRDGRKPPIRRFWVERTKKSSKDMDLAVVVCWLIRYARRPLKIQVVAANGKQAAIVSDRAVELLHFNPWLAKHIEIVQGIIRSKARKREVWCRIEATGSAGDSQGQTPDLLILNELVHVERWSVMEAHFNNADGVPQGVVIVSTNAGIKGSMAWKWRENALKRRRSESNPKGRWAIHILQGRAPWIDEEDVKEAKARDPVGTEYTRLWEGKWVSGAGGSIAEDDLDRAFCLPGPVHRAEQDWTYVGGIDLGVTHDHAGVVLLGSNERLRRIRVARLHGFAPSLKQNNKIEVDIELVRHACIELQRMFRAVWWGYDPAAGGSFCAQDLRRAGLHMVECTFSGAKNPTLMATSLVQALKEGVLELYDDEEGRLRRDFGKFQIKPLIPTGYRLEAVSDEYGHADVGTALVIALPKAVELMGGFSMFSSDDDLVLNDVDDEPLTEDEYEEMPDELRDIYDMGENPIKGKPGIRYNGRR
jgi:hypothetical protein